MKKIGSLLVALILLLNVSLGHTLTILYDGETTVKEVEANRVVTFGLGTREDANYVVDTNNAVLKVAGNRRQFVMPAEAVDISITSKNNSSSSVLEMQVGDYVTYYPTETECDLTELTGIEQDSLNPALTTEWRVLSNDGMTIELISCESVGNLTLGKAAERQSDGTITAGTEEDIENGKRNYARLVKILNEISKKYANNGMGRAIGWTEGHVEEITTTLSYENSAEIAEEITEVDNFTAEELDFIVANGLLHSMGEVWVAYQTIYIEETEGVNFDAWRLDNLGERQGSYLYRDFASGWEASIESTYGVRPIVILNSDIEVTGLGTEADPWVIPGSYTVTFNTNGGSSVSSKTVEPGGTYGTLPTTTRNAYLLEGWYWDEGLTNKVTSTTTVAAGNHTLYAKWVDDTSVVAQPGIPNLIDVHDTGSSATDNVTKYYEDLTIEGQVSLANAIVKIYKNGEYYGQTTSDEQGYWTTTVDNEQNAWTAYRATMIDENGNESNMSEALGIYSDTIAPSIPVIEQKYYAFNFEYEYSGYSVHPIGQVGTTNTTDPIINFRNTSKLINVSRVNIYLSSGGMSADSLVQVYYDTGSGYTEGQHVELLVTAGTEVIHVDIPAGTYNNIRVDIGSAVGLTYQINRIDFTADAGISHKNVVNEISSTDEASGIWGYNTHNSADTTWVGCGTWNEFATPVSLWYGYRAVDCAGNASTHISVPVNVPAPDPVTYGYTGSVQTYNVPATGIYKLEVWGAGGSSNVANSATGGGGYGGTGGYSMGYKKLSEGDVIYVTIGGAGSGTKYNGGGQYGGGGATHMATVSGTIESIGAANLSKILLIAGGGGSGGHKQESWGGVVGYDGGSGGGTSGTGGGDGSPGTQTSGSAFGKSTTGGGGGLYGGSSGTYSAGGGSGYIGGVPSFTYNGTTYSPSTITGGGNGAQTDGAAKISFVE